MHGTCLFASRVSPEKPEELAPERVGEPDRGGANTLLDATAAITQCFQTLSSLIHPPSMALMAQGPTQSGHSLRMHRASWGAFLRHKYSAVPSQVPPSRRPWRVAIHDAKSRKDILQGLRIMSQLNPDFGREGLPLLPPIRSDSIRMRVFTHRSFAARPTHVFEDSPDDPAPDNEQFEHSGDQVLGLIVTDLVQKLYPTCASARPPKSARSSSGTAPSPSCTRASAQPQAPADPPRRPSAVQYKLPEHLRLHIAQSVTLKASVHVQADVFEAYVGGLYKDQGLGAVKTWLDKLFTPYVREAYRVVRGQHGLPAIGAGSELQAATASAPPTTPPPSPPPVPFPVTFGHLGLFNQRLQQQGKAIEWVFGDSMGGESTMATPVWVAEARVDGECWGAGRGNTKKSAKNEAAKVGLRRMGVDVEH
ncbi:hypothetical protein BC834DRAFT_968356 [Gloeopeniophorella convolvens]|nr:hypothetical protein BC834DRAFT_968356 [Gloeopeniophorella convolvens]